MVKNLIDFARWVFQQGERLTSVRRWPGALKREIFLYWTSRYLNWIGMETKVFNLGDYRRIRCSKPARFWGIFLTPICRTIQGTKGGRARLDQDHQFFDHSNPEGMKIREEVNIFDVIRPDLVRFARRHWRMSLTGCQVVGRLQSLMPPTQQGNAWWETFASNRT